MLPRVESHYPAALETEHSRIASAYMVMLNKTLAEHLPTIRRAMAIERAGKRQEVTQRIDDFDNYSELMVNVSDVIADTFTQIQVAFEERALSFGLERRLANIANQTRRLSIVEWRRIVRSSLGVNILEDYYMGEFFRDALQQWITRNIGLIRSVPQTTLTEMRSIVEEGWRTGLTNREISRNIQAAYGISKRKAQFWARDQLAKLNANLTQQQQQDAGVQEYIWSTSGDERVRERHVELDGTRQSWANPPKVALNRNCHPGEDYRCRCVALPVFNLPGLSLPWEKGTDG